MSDWQLLDDSYKNIVAAHRSYKMSERASASTIKELIPASLPFGYPQTQTVFLSMIGIKHWLQKSGTKVHYKGLEKLKKIPGRRNIITPNHPNLFDSIATRLLFYMSGHFVPFTAAVDTLAKVPVVSKLLRQNGTFFINTKRFGDIDYREQVNTFMRSVTDHDEWLYFYAEGDRGAHERQRTLRHGLLKAMTDEPCAFYPISISYEKVPHSYVSGIGNLYIEVHDPILHDPDDNFERLVDQLGEQLQKGVNAYTTDLAATILLDYPAGTTLSIPELERDIDWLRAVVISREVPFVDTPILTALSYLNIKVKKGYVTSPAAASPESSWLLYHRERIMHALYDIADPPPFLAKEFAWTPPTALILDERLRELSGRAVAPLVTMYSSIITLLDQGINSVLEIEKKVVGPQIPITTVRNTLRILQAQKIITLMDGSILLN